MIGDIAITRPKVKRGAGLRGLKSHARMRARYCVSSIAKACPDVAVYVGRRPKRDPAHSARK